MIRCAIWIRGILLGLFVCSLQPSLAAADETIHDGNPERNRPATDVAEESGGDPSLKMRAAAKLMLEELAQKHGYQVDQNHGVARVEPPFPELRAKYFEVGHPTSARQVKTPPIAMVFHWDGTTLQNQERIYGEPYSLSAILERTLPVYAQDIEGPDEILNESIPGDWVIREGATQDQVLNDFAAILQKQLGMQLRLMFAKRVRTVYVARGKYQFTAIAREEGEKPPKYPRSKTFDPIEIYGEKRVSDESWGGGVGDLKELLGDVGRWIKVPMIDEVAEPPSKSITWHFHDTQDEKGNAVDNRNPDLVLKNLTAQTGIAFKKEYRAIRRLIVERIE